MSELVANTSLKLEQLEECCVMAIGGPHCIKMQHNFWQKTARSVEHVQTFHVHIDASNYAIGCILAQPGEHKMDFPISYASTQLNSAEKELHHHGERRSDNDLCGQEVLPLPFGEPFCLLCLTRLSYI